MILSFTVLGQAQPKGSAKIVPLRRHFPITIRSFRELIMSVALTSDNPQVKQWQRAVAAAAKQALGRDGTQLKGAVGITAVFYVHRPLHLQRAFTGPHLTRPDVDKLARSCLDALTGVLFRDDAQVTDLVLRKAYAPPGVEPRAEITVRALEAALPLFHPKQSTRTVERTV